MLNVKKSWFTLVEVILACSMFAIVVSWIVLAINRSFVFMENTKLSVRATNLAREWMEMVYNIRDTNRRRQAWERDKYWLNIGELNPSLSVANVYKEWVYALKEKEKDGNKYIYASKLMSVSDNGVTVSDINDFYNDGFWDDSYSSARNKAKLDFPWEYSYYERDEDEGKEKLVEHNSIKDALMWDWLEFYRVMRVFGVYEKNVANPNVWIADLGDDSKKKDGTPAEMRFCVKVFYASQWKHSTEICGVLTNFKE